MYFCNFFASICASNNSTLPSHASKVKWGKLLCSEFFYSEGSRWSCWKSHDQGCISHHPSGQWYGIVGLFEDFQAWGGDGQHMIPRKRRKTTHKQNKTMSKIQARKMSQACKQHGAKMIKKKKKRKRGGGKGGDMLQKEWFFLKKQNKTKTPRDKVLHYRRSSKRLLRMQQWSSFKFCKQSSAESEQCCMFHHEIPERRGNRGTRALTLLAGVHVCGQLHVIGREEPHLPVDFSFPPVGVLLVEDVDDLALIEGQLVVILRGVIVHPDHLAHCRRQARWGAAAHLRGSRDRLPGGIRYSRVSSVSSPKRTEVSGGLWWALCSGGSRGRRRIENQDDSKNVRPSLEFL